MSITRYKDGGRAGCLPPRAPAERQASRRMPGRNTPISDGAVPDQRDRVGAVPGCLQIHHVVLEAGLHDLIMFEAFVREPLPGVRSNPYFDILISATPLNR